MCAKSKNCSTIKNHAEYSAAAFRLVLKCIRREQLRCDSSHRYLSEEEAAEEVSKVTAELRRIDSETSAIVSNLRKHESTNTDLGMVRIQHILPDPLSDVEYSIIWNLYWASMWTEVSDDGRDLLMSTVPGDISDIPEYRAILQSDGMLRASGIVVVRSGKNYKRLTLLDNTFSLSEPAIRLLAHGSEAQLLSLECQRMEAEGTMEDLNSFQTKW